VRISPLKIRNIGHNKIYPVKRPYGRIAPSRMPSGALLVHMGRKSGKCASGFHKPMTKVLMNIPILVCARCGVRMAKGLIENTYRKGELVETVQKEVQRQRKAKSFIDNKTGQPISTKPTSRNQERALEKAKEEFYLRIWEKYQDYKRTKTGKLKYVGGRR